MHYHCHIVDINTTEGHSPCAIFNCINLCQLCDDQGRLKGAENGGMLPRSLTLSTPYLSVWNIPIYWDSRRVQRSSGPIAWG